MSVPLNIAGITYNYPVVDGEVWGTEATNWAIAVTDELAGLIVGGDIGPTTLVNIPNNQASPANVTNALFDPAVTRSAVIEYYVYRVWNTGANEAVENGTIYIAYKDIAATWDLVQVGLNVTNTGITFSITSGGQLQFTSDNKTPSTGYNGKMKFRARALQKT